MEIDIYSPDNKPSETEQENILNFLYHHLGKYGDSKSAIKKAINYALKLSPSPGGLVITAKEGDQIVGTTVINKTGMDEYIPGNILVYIATHEDHRGKGIGKKLMTEAIGRCEGGIALHVEPDNPAKILYEKLGFTNKYLEMRLT